MVKPKLIMDSAVRTQAIKVLSVAIKVHTVAKFVFCSASLLLSILDYLAPTAGLRGENRAAICPYGDSLPLRAGVPVGLAAGFLSSGVMCVSVAYSVASVLLARIRRNLAQVIQFQATSLPSS